MSTIFFLTSLGPLHISQQGNEKKKRDLCLRKLSNFFKEKKFILLLVTHAENEGIVLQHDNPFICCVGRRQVPNEVSLSSDDNICLR